MSNKWYIIEGNIGSGKTTLLDKLSINDKYEVIREPVDTWLSIQGTDGKNLLQEFYEQPTRYAYLFQTMVFKTRLQSLDHEQTKQYRFSERSIWTDRFVFGRSCIENKKMNQLEINSYHFWFEWLEEKFFKKPDGIIYLRCSPEKCYERMNRRGRTEESTVPLSYLTELHNLHEEWISQETRVPVLTINNETDDDWTNIMTQINNFI